MKTKAIILPMLLIGIMLIVVGVASACSCVLYTNQEIQMSQSSYVFSGEVVEIKTSGTFGNEMQEVTVRIIDHWKPTSFPESVNLKIYALKDTGANCGYNFVQGEKYLLYTSTDEETWKLMMNSCSGTILLSEAQIPISQLNESTNQTSTNPNQNQNEEESNIFTKFFSWIKNLFS